MLLLFLQTVIRSILRHVVVLRVCCTMMNARVALLVILSVVTARAEEGEKAGGFVPPTQPSGDVYFFETFNDEETFDNKWVRSAAKKEGVAEDVSKYDGEWAIEAATGGSFPEDKGLVMKSASKHHAIAAKLDRQFSFEAKDMFVVQYEVNFQKGMGCGGAYMKLLSDNDSLKLDSFYDKTPYTIMFGPDKCGADSKLHFIFRHKNPLTGSFEEKHAKPSSKLTFFDDRKTHLFTLVVRSDNTYSIMVDQFSVNEGSLLEDFTPPVNPDKEIDDPEDSKPDDWDEREKIPDPDASKPDDWDEDAPAKIPDMDVKKPEGWLDDGPEFIPDPESSKPEDWDDEMDGDWEPPMIPNPACQEVGCGEWKRPLKNNPDYKGKWSAPMIENPNYKGIWKPRRIPNPNFFEDKQPFRMIPIIAVGFELWTVTEDVYFDNIIITSELTVANNFAYESWTKKFEKEEERDGGSAITEWLGFIVDAANENPLLWALYAIVPILPCVLFMWCCCRSSGPEPQAVEEVLRRKKTDEPLPDEPSDTEDTDSGSRTKKKKGKTDEEESFVEEDELPTTEKKDENAEAGGDGGEEEEEPQREEVTESPRKARRRGKKKAERED